MRLKRTLLVPVFSIDSINLFNCVDHPPAFSFEFPLIVNEAIKIFIVSAIPLALFSLGGVLYKYKISKNLKISIFLIFISLLFHPLIVFALGSYSFSVDKEKLANGVIMAAMAPGLNSYFFANMYNAGKEVVASTILFLRDSYCAA